MSNRPRTCFARIDTLALLPVFHRLNGAKVLVVGGGEGAVWKAELMRAAGARIVWVAPEMSAEMAALVTAQSDAIERCNGEWTLAHFDGVRLAVMQTDCEVEAAAFEQAGRMSGVPVNVIDRPAFCQFQFGAIVNRSPAIISISTDGAAPILGQAIRRRIETLLPAQLAGWTTLAQKLRPRVNATYAAGRPRRAFWERFVDRVFSGEAPGDAQIFQDMPTGGQVVFVNIGPGDPELLTLKAMRAMQQADVVMFDASVPPQVLELARREAHRTQNVTLAALQRHVAANRTVVHLSASDATPHIAPLKAQAISVDIIPGVIAHPFGHRAAA